MYLYAHPPLACPPSFPIPYPILHLHLTNHASRPLCCCCSLQRSNRTALMTACDEGYTDCVIALLASPDINVNHADVSIYLLTSSHVVVWGEGHL